jgi:hypothetical protein
MKRKSFLGILFFSALMLFFVNACNNENIPRGELAYNQVIAEDLFTMFPGTLRVTSKHILLQNPFNRDAFLQVYDRQTGEELFSAGTIGQGPGDWNNPNISNVINDTFVVYDVFLKKYAFVDVNTITSVSDPALIQKAEMDLYQFVFLDKSHFIVANWKETHPFEMFSNGQRIACGKYPLKEPVQNTADRFQGILHIHPQRELFIYATIANPYIALYQIRKDNLKLIWENQFKSPQYTITENQLQWGNEQPDGVSDVAFLKDYIVCLVKDFKSEAKGRDVKAAPKAVYVFDYEGKLVHIFDLPVHSVRLAADAKTNLFYSVALEPYYSIVTYDLSSID